MNLHDVMANDLENVFFNLDEFASEHEINGKRVVCIVDDLAGQAETASGSGFTNPAGIGVLHGELTVRCKVSDFGQIPQPGEKITMDGTWWIVADGVSDSEGMLTLPLQRAY